MIHIMKTEYPYPTKDDHKGFFWYKEFYPRSGKYGPAEVVRVDVGYAIKTDRKAIFASKERANCLVSIFNYCGNLTFYTVMFDGTVHHSQIDMVGPVVQIWGPKVEPVEGF